MESTDIEVIQFSRGSSAFREAEQLMCDLMEAPPASRGPLLVGLSGPQGSGKTTLASRLVTALKARGIRALTLSLDDFYLRRREREHLARTVHPLLATRGVPGTHDVALAHEVLDRLQDASSDAATFLPVFDKARDDRTAQRHWRRYLGRPDVIVFEGWCIGACGQDAGELIRPVNELEAQEDPHGIWRNYVNGKLRGPYSLLFGRMDLTIALLGGSFEWVLSWRLQQEMALRARSAGEGGATMNEEQVGRFVAHFERITRSMANRPAADLLIELAMDRRPILARRGTDLTSCGAAPGPLPPYRHADLPIKVSDR